MLVNDALIRPAMAGYFLAGWQGTTYGDAEGDETQEDHQDQ